MIYTCIASNEAGTVEQHYRINRLGMNGCKINRMTITVHLVPPVIDSISIAPTATPIAGNHFTLDCNANGIPEPVISWHFNK